MTRLQRYGSKAEPTPTFNQEPERPPQPMGTVGRIFTTVVVLAVGVPIAGLATVAGTLGRCRGGAFGEGCTGSAAAGTMAGMAIGAIIIWLLWLTWRPAPVGRCFTCGATFTAAQHRQHRDHDTDVKEQPDPAPTTGPFERQDVPDPRESAYLRWLRGQDE